MPFLSPPSARLAVYKYAKEKAFTYLYSGLQFSLKGALCSILFPRPDTEIGEKSEYFGETLCAWKSLSGKFFGASTQWSLRTYRVSQKKHSYKIFGLEIMLFSFHLLADIVVRTLQQLHEMGHSAGVHHSLQDYYVCEQVKSMISSPKIL